MQSTVSIIIPVYNGGKKFKLCLDSLERCSPPPSEIIVVADGKSDGSYQLAAERGHKLIILEKNSGPAFARNTGAHAAQGEVILFIDADVTVQSDIISQVQSTFAKDKTLSALIGSYDDKPTELNLVSQYKNLQHHFTHQHSNEEASTFWGACGAVKKSVFIENMGFDPTYTAPSIEDIEFGYRLKDKGHSIKLQKDIQITHLKKWTLFSMLKTDIFQRALPWSKLILRNKKIINDLNISVANRLSSLSVLLLCMALLTLPFAPRPLLPAGIAFGCCVLLFMLNASFYLFLIKKRGPLFLLQCLPLHWLYFLYSGLCFAAVSVRQVTLDRKLGHPTQTSPCHD